MATAITVSVYNFSTGMLYDSRQDNVVIPVDSIISVDAASVYGVYSLGQFYFPNVRAKIVVKEGDVLKDKYVHQTPAAIATLINA